MESNNTTNKDEHQFFQISLKIILKNDKGEMLLLEMPDHSKMAGYFDFPGGRITSTEIKDSFEDILNREIMEEVGPIEYKIGPKPVSYGIHSYYSNKYQKDVHVLWLFFEGQYIKGKIKISPEHKRVIWQEINQNNAKKYFTLGPLKCIEKYLKFN